MNRAILITLLAACGDDAALPDEPQNATDVEVRTVYECDATWITDPPGLMQDNDGCEWPCVDRPTDADLVGKCDVDFDGVILNVDYIEWGGRRGVCVVQNHRFVRFDECE